MRFYWTTGDARLCGEALKGEGTRARVLEACKKKRVELKVLFYTLAGGDGELTLEELAAGLEEALEDQAEEWGFTAAEMKTVFSPESFGAGGIVKEELYEARGGHPLHSLTLSHHSTHDCSIIEYPVHICNSEMSEGGGGPHFIISAVKCECEWTHDLPLRHVDTPSVGEISPEFVHPHASDSEVHHDHLRRHSRRRPVDEPRGAKIQGAAPRHVRGGSHIDVRHGLAPAPAAAA